MIHSKDELRNALNKERVRWRLPQIDSWKGWMKLNLMLLYHPGSTYLYMYCLRNEEYYSNKSGLGKLVYKFYHQKRVKLQLKTGTELPPNVAGIGTAVYHGKVVVSRAAKIGEDCVILSDVTIGGVGGKRDVSGAAKIGNRVFISSGVKIIGPVTIADDVVIGANSVVVKDILESGITVAGIPAKKISNIGSSEYIRL